MLWHTPAGCSCCAVPPDDAGPVAPRSAIRWWSEPAAGVVRLTDPYGNTFAVHASLPTFPAPAGIAYVRLPCHVGAAQAIGWFYSQRMGALVRSCGVGCEPSASGGTSSGAAAADSGPAACGLQAVEVVVGPGQRLVYEESVELGPWSQQVRCAVQ
jgi:hypothetical protein